MCLKTVTAKFECDGCGESFTVDIDPAETISANTSPFDLAEEALRSGFTSVQHGKHLCETCTRAVDAIVPENEDRNATEAEMSRALKGV